MEDIRISDVLRRGFGLYKDNFRLLFSVSILYTVVQFIDSVVTLLNGMIKNGILFFVGIIVTLVMIYFSCRLLICMTIIARDLVQARDTSVRIAYTEAGQYFWSYVGNTIMVSLPLILPIFLIVLVQHAQMPFLNKLPLFAVLSLISGILISYFYFAPVSVALEPALTERIRYSIKLVKGKLFQVFSILFISSYIFAIPAYLINLADFGFTSIAYLVFTRSTIVNLINLVCMPFSVCIGVVMFYELKKLKDNLQ